MKIKNLVLALTSLMLLTSCGQQTTKQESTLSPTSNTEHEEPSDNLQIDDMYVFFENEETTFDIHGIDEENYEDIVYSFDESYERYIEFYGNIIYSKQITNERLDIVVTATYETLFTRFTVHYRNDANTGNEQFSVLRTRKNDVRNNWNPETKTTIFIGDSFFDNNQFWRNFYSEVDKGCILGISASTLEGWFYYAKDLLFDQQPESLVIHLGTNDFWDLRKSVEDVYSDWELFMNYLHKNLPNTTIYYITIENRSYAMPNHTASNTILDLKSFNDKVKEHSTENEYIKIIDSFSHFTNTDGTCKTELFKDGTHPIDSEYKFFINSLIEAGCDIEYIEPEPLKENEYAFSVDSTWGPNKVFIKDSDGHNLTNNYVVSGSITFKSVQAGVNAHLGFAFNDSDADRFLLWNSTNDGRIFYYCGAYKEYHNISKDYYSYDPNNNVIDWKVLVSEKHAYFFINDELQVVFLNLGTSTSFDMSAERLGCVISVDLVEKASDAASTYEDNLATLTSYEQDTRTDKIYIEA